MRVADEWLEAFSAAGVPVSPVLSPDELVDDPHTASRGSVVTMPDGTRLIRSPVVIPGANALPDAVAPTLGQHSQEILTELGYSPDESNALMAAATAS
jgi:crotonobetainyl-CoA:carnitine CoA-transferase CaiB-like acyl-CoA transferase